MPAGAEPRPRSSNERLNSCALNSLLVKKIFAAPWDRRRMFAATKLAAKLSSCSKNAFPAQITCSLLRQQITPALTCKVPIAINYYLLECYQIESISPHSALWTEPTFSFPIVARKRFMDASDD